MTLSNLSFKHKIITLITIPLIAFLWVSSIENSRNYDISSSMAELTKLTKLTQIYSELVHELQKERGATAGFIGSKGTKFNNKLKQQRQNTNAKLKARTLFLEESEFNQTQIKAINQSIAESTQNITTVRQQVDNMKISAPTAIKFYTELNAKLLSVSALITQLSKNSEISTEITAYYNFLQGKERAGIERAVLSNTFAQDKFGPNMYKKFIILVSEQNTYFDNFLTFSKSNHQSFYNDYLDHNSVKEVMNMRKVAYSLSTQGDFNTDATYWFEQSTSRIDQLKKIEDYLNNELLEHSKLSAKNTQNTMLLSIGLSILVLIIAIGNGFYIIRGLVAQVNELVGVMNNVKDNNDLTVRVKNLPQNELGEIGQSLNLTLDVFSSAINEISSSSITLAAAAEETSQTCLQNSSAMTQQQDQITLVAAAVEELSITIKEVAKNTQLTSDCAKEADSLSNNSLEVVQSSYLAIEDLAQEITLLSERITILHESSTKINSVVDVIKSVAEQTNLLALNAAIEAARAGEQGRGFSVVADEVRTLAQKTQESTSEIDSFINDLQNNANSAYSVIEDSKNKASKAVESAKNVEGSLESITSAIDTIVAMSEQIATAAEEQAMVAQDVAQNIVTIESKSMESTTGASQIAETAKEQAHLATSLQDIASTFKVNK